MNPQGSTRARDTKGLWPLDSTPPQRLPCLHFPRGSRA